MQPSLKTDLVYCLRILEAIGKIKLCFLMAHDYVGIDKLIVFVTITEHIPAFRMEMELVIQTELKQGNFKQTEYDLSRQSNFYRHIDFTNIE